MGDFAPKRPLSGKGKALLAAILVELLLMWGSALYMYTSLPGVVPTHFDLGGMPTVYGEKIILLVIPLAFSAAPIIFLAITKFRFALVNKFPYLINLPAFYMSLAKLPFEERGKWINKYFEASLLMGSALTLLMLLMELEIYRGAVEGRLSGLLPPFLAALFAVIGLYIYYLRILAKRLGMVTRVAGAGN